jgi:hypothetical protein
MRINLPRLQSLWCSSAGAGPAGPRWSTDRDRHTSSRSADGWPGRGPSRSTACSPCRGDNATSRPPRSSRRLPRVVVSDKMSRHGWIPGGSPKVVYRNGTWERRKPVCQDHGSWRHMTRNPWVLNRTRFDQRQILMMVKISLKTMSLAVSCGSVRLTRTVRCRTLANMLLNAFVRHQHKIVEE